MKQIKANNNCALNPDEHLPRHTRRHRRRRFPPPPRGPMDAPVSGRSVEDYSAAATVVRFDPPLPLLRAPVPSSASGEPPVLAFRDAASWRSAWETAKASLFSQCELAELTRSTSASQLVHGLGVQSLHHTNASPPGGKVCLELHQLIIKEERYVKNEKWLLVSKQQKRLALSFQRKNALHPSEMQGLLLRVSLKIQISLFGMLGITKHHQHPCVL